MSLRGRLLAAFAYALLVVIVALEVPLAGNLDKRVNAEVQADSAARAQVIAANAVDDLASRRLMRNLAATEARGAGGTIAIIDGQGLVVADSTGRATPGDAYATNDRPHVLRALGGEIAQTRGPALGSDSASLLTAVPIVRNGRTRGAIELAQPIDEVDRAVRDDILALIGVGVLALGLGLIVAWVLAGSIARPLRALADIAGRMSRGDLSARAKPAGSTEQQELARSFNEMAGRVEGMIESQRAFVADASHQLRTPLTGLRLRLESAGTKTRDAAVRTDLEAAEHETERLDLLVTDLLELAASDQPREPGEADLAASAGAAAERWRPAAMEQGCELKPSGPTFTPAAIGERDLAVILDNLIENAIKYTHDGSAIAIEWSSADGHATLAVENPGDPLGDEELQRAFERFYRGPNGRRHPGTGLGLAIVGALVRRAGGTAQLSNTADRRVRAELTLPTPNPDRLP